MGGLVKGVQVRRITKIERDLNGNVIKVTNPDLSERKFKYDPNTFDMIESYDVQHDIRRVATTNSFGQVVSYTDGKGGIYIKEYSSISGLLTKEKSPISGIEASYLYNSNGLALQKVLKYGGEDYISRMNYDAKGNVIEEILPSGKSTVFEYDNAGNVTKVTKKTSGTATSIENYEYDLMNRLTKVISAKNEITEYTYYPTGQLETVINPKNKVSSYQYNNMGQVVRKQQATGEVYTFAYDPNGKWSQETDPNGNIKTFEYNANNKVVKIQMPDDIVIYEYDEKDQVISASNKNSKISYTRDSLKRVITDNFVGQGTFANIAPLNIEYTYDKNNNRIKTILNNSVVFDYTFDDLNRLTRISNSYGNVFNYEFDSLSRITKLLRPNGETNYAYTADGLPTQIQHIGNGSLKQQFQYGYDLRNFVNQKRTPSTTENYSYDSNGQLIAKDGSGENEAYSYDSLGNRVMDNNSSYNYDTNSERLADDYNFSYLYDNNGNLIAKNPKNSAEKAYRYEYTSINQLKSVSTLENPFGAVIQKVNFEYDVLGRRIRKEIVSQAVPTNNGYTLFYYDGDNVVFETKYLAQTGNFGVVAAYTYGLGQDNVLAVNIPALGVTNKKAKQSGNYYFAKDNLGSITAIIDSNGSLKQQYSYSSYGKILKIQDETGTDITLDRFIDNQYTFTGREYDSEINTYYYRARYYDASIGRFLQQDPEAGNINKPISLINKYVYADNSPLMFTDPTGRSSIFGWLAIALNPALSLFLLNTTDVFQKNFGFTEGDKMAVNFAAITTVIIVAAVVTGGAAGAYFAGWGGSAAGAAGAGAVVGAITGAAIGMIGFPALGLGSAADGAIYGAVVGGIAGGIAGYMQATGLPKIAFEDPCANTMGGAALTWTAVALVGLGATNPVGWAAITYAFVAEGAVIVGGIGTTASAVGCGMKHL